MSEIYKIIDPELFPREWIGFTDPDDYYSYCGIQESTDSGPAFRPYYSFDELITHINERRAAMGYGNIPLLRQIIENYLYKLKFIPKTLFLVDKQTNRTLFRDINVGANLIKSLSREAISGSFGVGNGGWTTKAEANERALACINCPKNLNLGKSPSVRFANKIAALFSTARTTDHDELLLDCEVCGCPNESKVHYSAKVISGVTEQEANEFPTSFIGKEDQKPHRCWIREILESDLYQNNQKK